MLESNSPQKQTQASDLSLVRGEQRLTAAQHGRLQGEKCCSASRHHKGFTFFNSGCYRKWT